MSKKSTVNISFTNVLRTQPIQLCHNAEFTHGYSLGCVLIGYFNLIKLFSLIFTERIMCYQSFDTKSGFLLFEFKSSNLTQVFTWTYQKPAVFNVASDLIISLSLIISLLILKENQCISKSINKWFWKVKTHTRTFLEHHLRKDVTGYWGINRMVVPPLHKKSQIM